MKKGDKLMQFDLQYIRERASSEYCIVLFTGLTDGQEIVNVKEGQVKAAQAVAELKL